MKTPLLWIMSAKLRIDAVMKNVVRKYVAALLLIWYTLSIIGFDVHSCTRTGETFVASIAAGVSCEDIHPEHSCAGHGGCCGHGQTKCCCGHHCADTCCGHDGNEVVSDDCCQDDFHVLTFTGTVSSEEQRFDSYAQNSAVPVLENVVENLLQDVSDIDLIRFEEPDSGITMPDSQAFLSIWRI